jgi:type VI secretion system protein ImpH
MAAHDGGKKHPVKEWLYAEGPSFDFFQAVKLLEFQAAKRRELAHPPDLSDYSVGRGVEPSKEAVRFKSSVRLDFPADDIASVQPPQCPPGHAGCQAPVMTVNFMGLTGGYGPLPKSVTELILGRLWHKDRALRDFLDIFNHRLISLFYRIRKTHRFGLDMRPPGEDTIAGYVYAVLGLGTPALRDQIHDRPLLRYAGLLGQQPRSMVGLERLLEDHFKVGVEGEQFKGGWLRLEKGQWTTVGARGQNNRLGVDSVLGTRVWDQQSAFELKLGPLTLEQFTDFLPVGWGFGPLCEMVRFYVGDELDFSFRLTLRAGEARESRLSAQGGARLGWTSWLASGVVPMKPGRRPRFWGVRRYLLPLKPLQARLASAGRTAGEDSQVVISPASIQAFSGTLVLRALGLPPDKVPELLARMDAHQAMPSQVVVRQGEAGSSMFVIRIGSVRVTRREADGKEVTLGTLREGDFFGEMSLLAGRARNATVTALEECELLELRKKDLDEYIEQYPRFGAALRGFVERRVRQSRRRG